ncbi:MAG TPA: TMEM165/GDT1 family protein, partial [Geobacteraceae bacterium]
KIISAALFIFFGLTTILSRKDEDDDGEENGRSRRPLVSAFIMILFAEIGDKTQLATASLAAQYDSPLAVFSGSTLALWSVSLIGIFLGAQLSRRIPLHIIHKCAGTLFLLFGAIILYQAF